MRSIRSAFLIAFALIGCGEEPELAPLRVVTWTGQDDHALALDQELKIEFDRPLAKPLRASAIALLDEGEHEVEGMELRVVGRWIYLQPSLPLHPDLTGGSLQPGATYSIRLYGLPWLRALTAEDGQRLPEDLALRFRTATRGMPGALAGRGVDSSTLQLEAPLGREPLVFRAGEPILLRFTRGLDPRTLEKPAQWVHQGQGEPLPISLSLVQNQVDGAVVAVDLDPWVGWGVLTLPEGVEGLGGWPLPETDRMLRLVQRQ